MSTDLLAGAAAGLAVALPVGAIGSYLVGLAARERLGTAAAAALGVATVDGAYALLAALGGAGLQTLLREVAGPLAVLAGLVLVAVAVHTLRVAVHRYRQPVGQGAPTGSPIGGAPRLLDARRAYLSLIGLTAVNPATVLTFAAVVLGGTTSEAPDWWSVGLFALGAFAASAGWQLVLVGGGSILGRVLRGRRGQLGIAVASAALMLGLAVVVLLR